MSGQGSSSSPNPSRPHFCHQCNREIIPNYPACTCPGCGNGFIEEIPAHQSMPPELEGFLDQIIGRFPSTQQNALQQLFQRISNSNPDARLGAGTSRSQSRSPTTTATPTADPRPSRGVGATPRPTRTPVTHHHISINSPGGPVNHQLLNGGNIQIGHSGTDVPLMMAGGSNGLHGNLGDYAWGAGGIDNIITQLMGQMENTGVPPASEDEIASILAVVVQQTDVDKQSQCSVCMEYFKVGESVKKLKCSHMFHEECIVPWLKIHSTCPVCRKGLDGLDPPENAIPELPADGNLFSSAPTPTAPPQREYQEEDFD